MRLKVLFVVLLCFIFSLALATSVFAYEDRVFQRVFDILSGVFSLGFLNDDAQKTYGFIRGIIWLGLFTVIYSVLKRAGTGLFAGNASLVLAGVISTISIISLPNSILDFVAVTYSGLIAAILVGIVVLSAWLLLYKMLPSYGIEGPALRVIRLVFLFFLLFIIEKATNIVPFFVVIPLIPGLFPGSGFSGRRSRNSRRNRL